MCIALFGDCHRPTLWTLIAAVVPAEARGQGCDWLKHTTAPKPLLTIRRQQAYYVVLFCGFLFFWKAALIASPPSCSLLMKERNDHQSGMPWGSLGFTLRGTDDISSSRFKGLSSLFEVVARHTLEMIPESMILMKNVATLSRAKEHYGIEMGINVSFIKNTI